MSVSRPLISLAAQKNERFKRQPKQNGLTNDYNGIFNFPSN